MICSVASSQAAVVVQNSSFETYTVGTPLGDGAFTYTAPFGANLTGIANWTFSASSGDILTGTYSGIATEGTTAGLTTGGLDSPSPYPDGSAAAFIEVQGFLSQTLTGFDLGTQYTVSFYAAPRNNNAGAGSGQDLSVKFDATSLTFGGSATLDVPQAGNWVLYTTDAFTATATSASLASTKAISPHSSTTFLLPQSQNHRLSLYSRSEQRLFCFASAGVWFNYQDFKFSSRLVFLAEFPSDLGEQQCDAGGSKPSASLVKI